MCSSMIKSALISVFDKKNLNILVPFLERNNYHIYSTGGTLKKINEYVNNKQIVHSISDYTTYPEICDGRVKTLHPRIYGGILGLRDNSSHVDDLKEIKAKFFDLIVVNLYPFEKVLEENPSEDILLENIDIGGHTLLRAAGKNHKYISILSSPEQYQDFMDKKISNISLARAAFTTAMKYDIAINNWITEGEVIGTTYNKIQPLKYGFNPYMQPAYMYNKNGGKSPFTVLNGNPGYINLLDAYYAIHLVLEVKEQLNVECCASYKHNSPAGVAIATGKNDAATTFFESRHIDPKSSFGDFIGYSGTVDEGMAIILKKYVSDGIIAADFTPEALEILKTKKKGGYIILQQKELPTGMEYRDVNGVTFMQPSNMSVLSKEKLSEIKNESIRNDMVLGYITMKYTQSNSVCFVNNGKVIGIGAGQQNRVDCINIAGEKAKDWFIRKYEIDILAAKNIVMVSDAFLPFADNVETAAEYNVKYILQPGGSVRDDEIKEACVNNNIVMICSGLRAFTH